MTRALACLLLATWLVAPSANAQRRDTESPGTTALWVYGPNGPRTYIRAPGGRGRWLRGVHVLVEGVRVEIRVETVEAQATCDLDPCSEPRRPLSLRRLIALRGERRELLLGVAGEGAQMAEEEILVHASLGPFLVVERRAWSYHGGAHGSESRSILWFDLRDSSRVSVGADGLPVDLVAAEAALRERYRAGQETAGYDPLEWMQLVGGLRVQGVVPRFRDGAWGSDVHLAIGVPYGATEGHTSYAIESIVRVSDIPSIVARHARVPRTVLAFLQRQPDTRLGGVSGWLR